MTNLHKKKGCQIGESNPVPSEYQADVHPTELPGPVLEMSNKKEGCVLSVLGF